MSTYGGSDYGDDDPRKRTLYVGNLDPEASERFIAFLFSQIGSGSVKSCKMIHEPGYDPYCFVEFNDPRDAQMALATMNGRMVLNKQLKVNWAQPLSSQPKQDTSKHHHVFVGDLCQDVEAQYLKAAFAMFGEVSDVKIIHDATTKKPKGYGFVSFINKEDAQRAIKEMQGALLGGRNIRTNWATRKQFTPSQKEGSGYHQYAPKQLNYDDVHKMSSATNCTVYCGQGLPNLTEDLVRQNFEEYGEILEIRIFKDKGYAFIRFSQKDDATRAIVGVNGSVINDVQCKCSWGKESNETGGSQQQPQQQQSNPYNQSYYQYQQPYNYQQAYQGYMQQQQQQQQGAYQQYYGNYGMPMQQAYGNMAMGGQGGGPQGQGYNGQQMPNMGYQ